MPERPYVHVPVTLLAHAPLATARATVRAAVRVVGTGRGIPGGEGTTQPGPTLVLPGPNQCQDPTHRVPAGTPGQIPGPPHTCSSRTRSGPIVARFRPQYTKVSQ